MGADMTFQRIAVGLFVLLVAALGAAFYIDWRLNLQVRTLKAFVEGWTSDESRDPRASLGV